MKHSEATKRKLSAQHSGAGNPFYGRKHTPETRAKLRTVLRQASGLRRYVPSPQSVRVPKGVALGYLAGLLDGEGSIGIRKAGVPYLSIYNTSPAVMTWLKVNVGGSVGGSPDTRGRVPCYHWVVQAQNDVQALGRALLPYLLVKGRDCEAALDWIRRRQHGR